MIARRAFPAVFLVAAPVAIGLHLWLQGPASWPWWLGAAGGAAWLTIYGYNVGAHYTFAHRLFRWPRPLELLLLYSATIASCTAPVTWAAFHTAHHRHVDTEGDPHAPGHLGWRAALTLNYKSDTVSPMLVRRLLADPAQRFAESPIGFWAITLSWPALAFLAAGVNGLVYLWLLPVWYVLAVAVVFIFNHLGEEREDGVRAQNSRLLGWLSGDGDHLEHHRNAHACGRVIRASANLLWRQA